MALPEPGLRAMLLLLAAAGVAAAQEPSAPAPAAPQGGAAPPTAQGAPAPPTAPQGGTPPPAVLGAPASPPAQQAPAPAQVPPVREPPRAHVSIVSPSKSPVLKRQRGTRTQDGAGLDDGAAEDVPEGPTVERLE